MKKMINLKFFQIINFYYKFLLFDSDFKVNEMDASELRKSLRKQKLERQGLTLSTLSLTQATGTSDDEDEASTPSGDNAERSLASTFGGSTDNIPQETSSTFLQAALDGPGRLQSEKSKT